jgi:menaquinol-cytochrome c reductase iron-sulfur subunit
MTDKFLAFGQGVPISGGLRNSSPPPAETTRRGFLKFMTGLMSALVAVALGIPLIGTIIGPSFRQKKPQWAKVGDIDSLSLEEPTSMKFPFKTEDAYLRETVIHEVWVIKHSPSEVTVFSPICPHLGCRYSWHPETKEFACPCHGSIYSITGKVLGGPAPRPLDALPTKLEKGELFVEWETFKVGIPEKILV